jgi:hypothetical protein
MFRSLAFLGNSHRLARDRHHCTLNLASGKGKAVSGDSIETSLPVWYVFSRAYVQQSGNLATAIKTTVMRRVLFTGSTPPEDKPNQLYADSVPSSMSLGDSCRNQGWLIATGWMFFYLCAEVYW